MAVFDLYHAGMLSPKFYHYMAAANHNILEIRKKWTTDNDVLLHYGQFHRQIESECTLEEFIKICLTDADNKIHQNPTYKP